MTKLKNVVVLDENKLKAIAKLLGEARECSYIYRVNNDKNKQKPN